MGHRGISHNAEAWSNTRMGHAPMDRVQDGIQGTEASSVGAGKPNKARFLDEATALAAGIDHESERSGRMA